MRAFAVANEMGRGGVSAAVAAAFVVWYALMTWNPGESGGHSWCLSKVLSVRLSTQEEAMDVALPAPQGVCPNIMSNAKKT